MSKQVRLAAAVLAAAVLFSLFACGREIAPEGGITLVDQAGRTVSLPAEARRVVSCYYVTSYAMLALGQGDKLVGIEKKADTRPIYRMAMPSLPDLPAVGTLKAIDVELIASLEPDLVILPKKLADSADALGLLGIPALVVDPETDAGLREMLTLLGKACGASDRAASLLDFYDDKLSDFSFSDERPTVLFTGNSSYLTAAPGGMYQSDLIRLAGGTNALASSGATYWQELSYEAILALDPDWIVIPAGAAYTADEIASDGALSALRAVQGGRVVKMPGDFEEWDSPIPSGVLGVLWLRAQLFPEKYSPETFRKDLSDFYETFYGFKPDEALLYAVG